MQSSVLAFLVAEGESYRDQREEEDALFRAMSTYSVLSRQYLLISGVAAAIAAFGLMANSAVVIVGAMLVAPLMKPILSLSYSAVIADIRLAARSLLTLIFGMLVAVGVAALLESVVGLKTITTEMTARTEPSLIDLGIAIAAGTAAGLAAVRKNVADSLPGVAIAVALFPPLCVSGIGLSLGYWDIGLGAALLFGVNLIAIILTTVVVFLVNGYGHFKYAGLPLVFVACLAFVIALPLERALRELKIDDIAQTIVEDVLHTDYEMTGRIHPNDLSRLDTIVYPDHVFIFLELKAPGNQNLGPMLDTMHGKLKASLDRPVNLKVQLLLTSELLRFDVEEHENYGAEDVIPRR